jgi:hypothetical protein
MTTASKKSAAKKPAAKKASGGGEEGGGATRRERSIQGYPADTKLRFGLINPDAQEGEEGFGKRWSANHGPRRAGSQKAELWSKLRNGMTIRQAKEAGMPAGFISKNLKRGWLEVPEGTVQTQDGGNNNEQPEAQ